MTFFSCKLNQPETIKRHRTEAAAMKRVGDYGVVYDQEQDTVKQVFKMANGTLKGFDTEKQPGSCEMFDFDMRKVLRESGHIE